jgi:hypothetical protein
MLNCSANLFCEKLHYMIKLFIYDGMPKEWQLFESHSKTWEFITVMTNIARLGWWVAGIDVRCEFSDGAVVADTVTLHTAALAQLRSYTRVNCCLLQRRTASPVGNARFPGPAWIPGNRLKEHGRNKVSWIKGTVLGYSQWIKYSESTGGEDKGNLFEWFSEERYTVCLWFRIT